MEALPFRPMADGVATDVATIRSLDGTAGVLVLGPGRSGTSSITSAFVAAGFFVGEPSEVLGASDSNRLGHYEPLPVLELDEELLAELGCSWWAGRPDPAAQLARREQFEPRIAAVLEAMLGRSGDRPLAVKEPRVNSLLPLWGPVADGVLHPVLAVRDPVEIALSQARRDSTTPAHALASWEVQMATVLAWLQDRTVTVAPYGRLLARPELGAEMIASASAHLEPRRRGAVSADAAAEAFDPGQRNEAPGERAHAEYLTARQRELWEFLDSLPAGDVALDAPAALRSPSEAALAAVGKECELIDFAAEHGRVARLLKEAGERGTEAAAELARLAEEVARSKERVRELEAEQAQSDEQLAASEARHAADVAAVERSLSWRITRPLRGLRRR